MLCVVARFQGEIVGRYAPPREEVSLGSSAANEIRLPFPGVSRRHATVRATGTGVLIRDLDSKNKLIVAGQRVDEVELQLGVVVQIGKTTLSLEQGRTSDFELALQFEHEPSRGQRDAETRSATGAAPAGAATALGLVREIENLSRRAFRRAMLEVLGRARLLIGAESIVAGSRGIDGTAAIVAISGTLPPAELLPQTKSCGRSRVTREVSANAIASTQHREWLLATFPDAAPREAWVADFIDYLAARCFNAEASGHDELPLAQLAIPEGMVVGESPAIRALMHEIRATVHSGLDVLLTGETGTGKELCARMIHDSGPTAGGPFIAVNCAAVPEHLLESDLFGVQARVATGVDPRIGRFQQAHGGTMFLDEVGELPLAMQAKLLRVVQEREILPLGAPAPRKLEFRVISASNRDLARDVAAGTFRADLFYRLAALHFHLPALRERREDIPAIVTALMPELMRLAKRQVAGVSRSALRALLEREWPGNIRELRNEVAGAIARCTAGEALSRHHLRAAPRVTSADAADAPARLQSIIDAAEREAIDRALAAANGNRTRAAKLLGITRNGLAMKMRRHGFS